MYGSNETNQNEALDVSAKLFVAGKHKNGEDYFHGYANDYIDSEIILNDYGVFSVITF